MNLDIMIATAYGHFLQERRHYCQSHPIFVHYAKDELDLPENEIDSFIRVVHEEDEGEIDSSEFDRFYTWYYINYMVGLPVTGA